MDPIIYLTVRGSMMDPEARVAMIYRSAAAMVPNANKRLVPNWDEINDTGIKNTGARNVMDSSTPYAIFSKSSLRFARI